MERENHIFFIIIHKKSVTEKDKTKTLVKLLFKYKSKLEKSLKTDFWFSTNIFKAK